MSEKVIQSYVFHESKCFFVSTINRAAYGGLPYAETFVWEYNHDTKERGELVHQDEDTAYRMETHFDICRQLSVNGEVYKVEL